MYTDLVLFDYALLETLFFIPLPHRVITAFSAHSLTHSSSAYYGTSPPTLIYTQVPRLYLFIFTAYRIHPSKVRIHFDFLMKNKYLHTGKSETSAMKIRTKKMDNTRKFLFGNDEKMNYTRVRNFYGVGNSF